VEAALHDHQQARFAKPRSSAARQATVEALRAEGEEKGWTDADIARIFNDLEYSTMRETVLSGKPRLDGRDLTTVRPINVQPASCRAPTARRCSPAARPRPS
jgi:polyribonucleotide nucleotidyltransferase